MFFLEGLNSIKESKYLIHHIIFIIKILLLRKTRFIEIVVVHLRITVFHVEIPRVVTSILLSIFAIFLSSSSYLILNCIKKKCNFLYFFKFFLLFFNFFYYFLFFLLCIFLLEILVVVVLRLF